MTLRSPSRKLRFSVIGENLVDALGGRPFDLVVGIDERQIRA